MTLDNKTILITGGTGSFGHAFTQKIFSTYSPKKVIIYARDEYKHFKMQQQFKKYKAGIRHFIGDIRDRERLYRAFENVDYVVHAAALKQVPLCEYNPFEAVKTNIHGAQNIIDAAVDKGVSKVVALSTDKAVNPINLYGATKMVSDKIFIAANAYSGTNPATFSVVRYGNVSGSRGSVIPFFRTLLRNGEKELPVTDIRMTRFWITLDEAVDLVFKALKEAKGGETYISKIPSYKIIDLAMAIAPSIKIKEVGIREGEKLHEVMITKYDSFYTYEYDRHYIIYPHFEWWEKESRFTSGGRKVSEFFEYASDTNNEWLDVDKLVQKLKNINP